MAILKDLIVHGSSRFLNKIYASEIQTPLIEAEAGIIKKLKADDATVVGLLDVKGQLHTNSWSNSNIATIDGSFYITPTIGSDSGTVTITATSLNFSGTNYAVTSLYLGDNSSITWPQYSKVLVTGQILSNGEWIPLGTLLGQLSAQAAAASIKINNIKDNKNQTSSVLATLVNNGTTSSDYRNLKVSLYQRASSSTAFYPLGIYITATGDNGRTFLDIYGGVESLENNANHGGFAEPNVRIGNLQGLPNVGGQTPSGWGIYTDNGYFKGIIAADRGYIGTGSKYWVIGNYEDGSNSNNDRSYIYNGTNSITSTTQGVYLGTDGIRNYKDSTHYVTIKNGVISALGVDLSGKIIATSGTIGGASITNGTLIVGNANINDINASKINTGDIAAARIQTNLISAINAKVSDLSALTATIGGFQIDSSSVHTKSVAITSNVDNSIALSSADFTRTINSTSRTGLRFAIGDKFGVTGDGKIYASSVDLTGKITATSGTIGGINITNGKLDVSAINIGDLSGEIGGRNLLSKDNILSQTTPYTEEKYIYTGLYGAGAGLKFPASIFEIGTRYVLSFKFKKISGTLTAIGGHCSGFSSFGKKFIIDGKKEENRIYSQGYLMNDDSDVHSVEVYLIFNGDASDNNLYIQPNRGAYTQSNNNKFQIWDLQLEKGDKATAWTPAPEDIETDINNARKTATNYITQINNTGIKITPYDKSGNDYLQINSNAISMYRNNIETLRIEDSTIRVGKANEAHFSLTSSRLTGYGDNNNVYFDVGKSSNTTIQLFYGDGDRTSFEMGPLVKEIVSVKKENNTLIQGTDYTIDTVSIWYDIYFKQEPALNSTVKVSYESTNKEFIYTVGSSQNITTEQVVNPEGRYKTTIVSQSVYKVREISQKSSMGEDWWNPIYNYGSELEGNVYKYTFYTQTAIENGEKFKLTYLLSDDSNFTPDIETKEYTWDTSRQGSLNLTVSGVNEIQTVKVNNVSVNYTTEGPLYKDYVILNTALGQDEKIEVEFKTRNYNSEYYSTYFNFSNMNKENSVKGIGSASFGSENVNKGVFCLAEGVGNTVTGYASHAEGYNNVVAGSHAHAEGWSVKALGENSHAGGSNTTATGLNSFVHGNHLNAIYPNSAAFGYGNSAQSQLFSIGMGLSQNAFSVNQDGDIQIGGRLLSGTTYENRIPLFKVVERTFTGHGIGRNGGMTRSRDITIAGYKPIAILGIVVGNSPGHPTSGQVDASWCVVSRFWIGYDYTNDHSDYKTDSIYYYIWNLFTGTNVSGGVSVDITFKFLYISQTAYMGLTQSQTTPNN